MKKLAALIGILFSLASYGQTTISVVVPPDTVALKGLSKRAISVTGVGGTYDQSTGIINLTGGSGTGGGGATLDSTKKNYDSITAHNARLITLNTSLIATNTALSTTNTNVTATNTNLTNINTALSGRIVSDSSREKADSTMFKGDIRRASYPAGLPLTPVVDYDGNSIMLGSFATNSNYAVPNLVSKATNTTANVTAVGGSGMREAILRRFTSLPAFNAPNSVVYEIGVNDMRNVSTNVIYNEILEGYRVLNSNQYMDTCVAIASSLITKGGTWTNLTTSNISSKSVIKLSAIPIQSSVAGSTLTFPWQASNLVIGFWGVEATHTAFGRFTVTVDGVLQGTYDTKGRTSDYNQSGTLDIRMPNVVVLYLSAGKHTVVITTLDNLEVDFDYIGRMGNPSRVPSTIMQHVNYSSYTAYSGGFNKITRVDTVNQYIDSIHKFFADRGYPIKVARVENYLDTATDLSEGLHPNDQGYFKLSKGVLAEISQTGGSTGGYVDTLNNQTVNGDKKFTGTTTIVGKTTSDAGTFGAELLNIATTNTNWSAGNVSAGVTHTTGSTTPYTTTLAATSGSYYKLIYTVSGRTAGTINITFGGTSISNNFNIANSVNEVLASSTAAFIITTTTDFDGTVAVSLVALAGLVTPSFVIQKNTGVNNFGIPTVGLTSVIAGLNIGSRLFATSQNNAVLGNSTFQAAGQASQTTVFGVSAANNFLNPSYVTVVGFQAANTLNDGSTAFRAATNSDYWGALTTSFVSGVDNEHTFGAKTKGHGNSSQSYGNSTIAGHYFDAGSMNFIAYGAGTVTGTPTYILGTTTAGKVVEMALPKQFTASGTGAATTISIPHGLTGVTSASAVNVNAMNAASAGISYITADATNINIIYTTAPASGTSNLLYTIFIKP